MIKKYLFLISLMLLTSIVCFGQIQIGLGAKLLGRAPFGIVCARSGLISGELGVGFSSMSLSTNTGVVTLSLFWYSGLAKFYFLPLAEFADIYGGAGLVGITVTLGATTGAGTAAISGSMFGLQGTAGFEVRLGAVALFGGGDLIWFFAPDTTVPLGGPTYHLGIRYDFAL